MSSSKVLHGARSEMLGTATTTTTKKKFGKNLNKLVKPMAPPVPDNGKNGRYYDSKGSKNGMLLLSTKKATNGSTSGTGGSGLLASSNNNNGAAPPRSVLNVQYETSMQDAIGTSNYRPVDALQQVQNQHVPNAWGVTPSPQASKSVPSATSSVSESIESYSPPPGFNSHSQQHADDASWDEYAPEESVEDDQQGLYMSRLAKERAERVRAEEAAREVERKQRAAERLRELDSKTKNGKTGPPSMVLAAPSPSAWGRPAPAARTLWEPEKPHNEIPAKDAKEKQKGISPSSLAENHHQLNESHHPSTAASVNSKDLAGEEKPVIHLSSYEDRDRGEKNAAAAPRMLYDPKSGAMVAVKARDESLAQQRRSKERSGTNGNSGSKDKKTNTSSKKESSGNKETTDSTKNARGKSGKQTRKEEKQELVTIVKAIVKKPPKPRRALPRTCGVLYKRDEKGIVFCADECEGDLGYGSHSVPGGRVKNPDAYAKFIEDQQHQQELAQDNEAEDALDDGNYYRSAENDYSPENEEYDFGLTTGFQFEEEKLEPVEWVKATDKIELVTGVDDSPTLKPTAKEWAPSQAAIAAAAAAIHARAQKPAAITTPLGGSLASAGDLREVVQGDDDDDDDDVPITGLGFDPTQDMDFVMQSPSHVPEEPNIDVMDLNALNLESSIFSSTSASSGPRHLFAFGTSGTWGQGNAAVGDWGLPSSTETAGGLFGLTSAFRTGSDHAVEPASFLSLHSTGSWGSPGFHGLGGLNGESTTSTPAD